MYIYHSNSFFRKTLVILNTMIIVFLTFQAYRQGLYGSRYVWILNGPVFNISRAKLRDFDSLFSCTFEEFLEVTTGIFTLNYDMIDSDDSVTVSNFVSTHSVYATIRQSSASDLCKIYALNQVGSIHCFFH